MGKRPAFMFYTGDWKKSPELSLCGPATRGIWLDLMCAIHDLERRESEILGTPERLSRLCRCTKKQMNAAIKELDETGTAIVKIDASGLVSITCRRMVKDWDARKDGKEKKAKQRNGGPVPDVSPICPDDVPPMSPRSSSSSSVSSSPAGNDSTEDSQANHVDGAPTHRVPPEPKGGCPCGGEICYTGDGYCVCDGCANLYRVTAGLPLTPENVDARADAAANDFLTRRDLAEDAAADPYERMAQIGKALRLARSEDAARDETEIAADALADVVDMRRSKPKARKTIKYTEAFECFWAAYDERKGKAGVFKCWEKACQYEAPDVIAEAAVAWLAAWGPSKEYRIGPRRWLNEQHWSDPLDEVRPKRADTRPDSARVSSPEELRVEALADPDCIILEDYGDLGDRK